MKEIKNIKQLNKLLKNAFQVELKILPVGNLISIWYEPDTDVTKVYTTIKTSTIINMVEINTFLDIK